MLLTGKTTIVYGGGGAIGGAVARTFAREGAKVFIAGRTLYPLQKVASQIQQDGGAVDIAQVDALDPSSVSRHIEHVLATTGRVDVSFNAIGVVHVQGPPIAELSLEDFMFPITAYIRANFITAKAAVPAMIQQSSGVILTLSTPGSRISGIGFLGYGTSCGAIETFSRILAGELGSGGIRVVCLRSDAIPETLTTSHARAVFEGFASRAGVSVETMLAERAQQVSLLRRAPSLKEVAEFAAFVASERAGAMTGAVANLTCGSVVD